MCGSPKMSLDKVQQDVLMERNTENDQVLPPVTEESLLPPSFS